jgi:outer membrane protein assembly factor BamB
MMPAPGVLLWSHATEGVVTRTSAVANGVVYVPGLALYALDANTGALIWQVENDGLLPVTVVNNIVYGESGDGLVALNAQTGALIWKFAATAINSGVAVVNGVVFAATRTGDVWALDAGTGALIWSRHFGVSATPKPTLYSSYGALSVANGTVYVAAADFKSQYYVYALNSSTGATIWKSQSVGQFGGESTPAVANGMVYVVGSTTVFGLNAGTGALNWQTTLPNSSGALSPIVANGVVYVESFQVGGLGHDFFVIDALDANTGNDLWEHVSVVFSPLRTPTPAIVNGMLYGPANDENSSVAIGAFGLPN